MTVCATVRRRRLFHAGHPGNARLRPILTGLRVALRISTYGATFLAGYLAAVALGLAGGYGYGK